MDGESKTIRLEAKCSECGEWSEISWFEFEFYAGYWWIESGPCPQCGEAVRVDELKIRSRR
jgi:endogenous inhibitor of DNA gyrase (YacG/DUF329 family)